MTTAEQVKYIKANYSEELTEVLNTLETAEYRDVESVIDKIDDPVFTRYCVTLLVDELISFETEEYFQDTEEE